MRFHFEPMNAANAEQLTHWHYQPPLEMYNSTSDKTLIPSFVDPQNAYYSILDNGEMVAFCCFGKEAQVPGGDYGNVALDIGLGVRPDLIGLLRGLMYIADVLNECTLNVRFHAMHALRWQHSINVPSEHGKKLVSYRYKHFLHKTMGNHSLY